MGKHYGREFDSLEEMIEYAKRPNNCSLGRDSRDYECSNNWDLRIGWEGSLKLAENGWPEGRERIHKMSEKLFSVMKPESHQQDVTFELEGGGYVDIGRYVEGDPECFGEFRAPENPLKVIRIEVCFALYGDAGSEIIANRGAAIVALIDLLEIRGYRCEIVGCDGTGNRGDTMLTQVLLKSPQQLIDIDKLAFCFAHPAFARRIGYGVMEQEAKDVRDKIGIYPDGGYGSALDLKSGKEDVYIPTIAYGHQKDFKTEESCVEWIQKVIKTNNLIKEEKTEEEKEREAV